MWTDWRWYTKTFSTAKAAPGRASYATRCFYYLMKPRHTRELDGHGYTHGVREEMHWIDIDALDTVRAYPSFLKDYLATRPAEILHIVTDQRACPTAPRDGR